MQRLYKTIAHTDFYKGLLLTFAIAVPILVAYLAGSIQHGVGPALGVLMCSASDVPGSFRHRTTGILAASLLAGIVTLLMGLMGGYGWLMLLGIGVLSFASSFLSVFGFRASLVSFAGLMAVVLSLAGSREGSLLVIHSLGVTGGGIWYLLLSTVFHFATEKKQVNQLLADCTELTAGYLSAIWVSPSPNLSHTGTPASGVPTTANKLQLQSALNEVHETLRESILTDRRHSGTSNYQNRQLILFSELVDIYELSLGEEGGWQRATEAIATYEQALPEVFSAYHQEITDTLRRLENAIRTGTQPGDSDRLPALERAARDEIRQFVTDTGLPGARQGALAMHNLLDYLSRLAEKLEGMRRVLNNLSSQKSLLPAERRHQFITQQDYDPRRLREHFDLSSPMFRHSLRMALTMMAGFLIGKFFAIQNAYWILLTIVVIMRPNYSLTKQRAIHRLIGTLIGAGIALAVVFLTDSLYIYSVVGAVSMVFAFTYIRKNYRLSSVFITLNIIFIYVLVQPDALSVIQYRVLDTLTGAALAFLANTFLLPSWEHESISTTVSDAIDANGRYLDEVTRYYRQGGEVADTYRMARKKAFLAVGNLNAAFQRMSQDPKTHQPDLTLVYEMTALNQSFLSGVASLGAYMRTHPTGIAGEAVGLMAEAICHKLNTDDPSEKLTDEKLSGPSPVERARKLLAGIYEDTSRKRDQELALGQHEISKDMLHKLQEIKIVGDQLNWLYGMAHSVSEKKGKLHF